MPDDAIERARAFWNDFADEHNQWGDLSHGERDALLAFASQQAPEGWMLINTAPKDGEPILIWKPDERMVGEYMMAAYWTDDHHSGEPGFVPVGGHHKLGYLSRVTGTPQGYPTHWQPLPAPPAMLDAAPSVTLGEVG